jgi:hypothetical protein
VRKPVVSSPAREQYGLIARLADRGDRAIVTLDLSLCTIGGKVDREITGSILDRGLLERVLAELRGAGVSPRRPVVHAPNSRW